MGLLDFFRRRGGIDSTSTGGGGAERSAADERDEASVGPAGFGAEGPPVGTSDPGALTGDDADRVAGHATEE